MELHISVTPFNKRWKFIKKKKLSISKYLTLVSTLFGFSALWKCSLSLDLLSSDDPLSWENLYVHI